MTDGAELTSTALDYLRLHISEAFFVAELAAALRSTGASETQVTAAVADLHGRNLVCVQHVLWSDPHLPVDGFQIVSALADGLPRHQAEEEAISRIESTWNRWLRSFLASHRCM